MIIKDIIKEQMEYWNMSQNDLVLKSGIDQKGLSDISRGKRELTIKTSAKLGKAFGLEPHWLFHSQEKSKEIEAMKKDKDLNKIAEYLNQFDDFKLMTHLSQLDVASKFIRSASFANFKEYVNSKVIGMKSYKDKTLAYFWIALMDNKHGAKMSDKPFVKAEGNKVTNSSIKTMLVDIPFELKVNKVKSILHDSGIILNNGPFIKDSTIYGVSILRNKQRHIFMSDMSKKECKYIFTLIHELIHIYGKNGMSEAEIDRIAIRKIKKVMNKEDIVNRDMDVLLNAYETKNWDSIHNNAKARIEFGTVSDLIAQVR